MRQFTSIILLLFFFLVIPSCQDNDKSNNPSYKKLAADFKKPPASSRPGAFWCWLNGDVTKESITTDLEEMKAKGMGRAEIWDVAAVNNPENKFGTGDEFLGDKSVDLIKHALNEGKRLGIQIGMIGSSGWNAGGTWVEPEWASKALYFSETFVNHQKYCNMGLKFPKWPKNCPLDSVGIPVFHKDVAILAVPYNKDKKIKDLSNVIDLTDKYKLGMLSWEMPEGDWVVIRCVCSNTGQTLIVPSPKSSGLFIDFLDQEATKRHLKYILDRLDITIENASNSGLSYIEFDSMELDPSTPWTNNMQQIFMDHHAYDLISYIPIFAGWEIAEKNEPFLYDFKKTVSDQLILSHYTTGRDFLSKYGMDLVAEAGGPGPPIWETCPVDALKALGNVSIPRGEFWIQHRKMFLIKEVASASHIYGQKLVDAESFTTWRRWKDSPYSLKKWLDRAFCEGLNEVTIHTFANTRPEHGLPGRTYHAGIDINPATTWWENAKPFMDYMARCSYLLRQGLFVGDVAYYYGDKAPNFFPEYHDVPEKPTLRGLSEGFDFDIVNTDIILNRMSVKDGKIVLPDGMTYSVLVLPNREDIPIEVLRKADKLISEGAAVLLQNSEMVKNIKSKVLYDKTIDEALAVLDIQKDFSVEDYDKLDYIHRILPDMDIYFIRNKSDQLLKSTCTFRQTGKSAEFWDPSTGERFSISDIIEVDKVTNIDIELDAYASCFIVFSNEDSNNKKLNIKPVIDNSYQSILINNPWTIQFPEGWGAPSEVQFNKLSSWINNENEGIKYFSGTATYLNTFNVPKEKIKESEHFYVDLGKVRDLVKVFINDKPAGIIWKEPFQVDISNLIKGGNNELKIELTNMWINRLTGDMKLPMEERYCYTNQPFILKDNWAGGGDETYHIQDAGLLGPVKLLFK